MRELLNEISNLFKKYGIKRITMDDIAKELGISKKTLYHFFKNKNDVVYKVAQHELKIEYQELANMCRFNSNSIEQLLKISKYLSYKLRSLNPSLTFDMNKYYPQIWSKLIAQRNESIHKLINQNLNAGMEQGLYRSDLNTNIIAGFYTFLLDIKGFEVFNEGIGEHFDKVFDILFVYHVRGIASAKGIDYLEKQFKFH